jgi:hypothetical protein
LTFPRYFREISLGKNLLHISAEAAELITKGFLVTLGVHETISTKSLLEIAETQVGVERGKRQMDEGGVKIENNFYFKG